MDYFCLLSDVIYNPFRAYNILTGDPDKLKKLEEVLQESFYTDSSKTNTERTFEIIIGKYGLEDGIRRSRNELGVKYHMFQEVLEERFIFNMRRLRIRYGISCNKGD